VLPLPGWCHAGTFAAFAEGDRAGGDSHRRNHQQNVCTSHISPIFCGAATQPLLKESTEGPLDVTVVA
jgi:hypothetical protein